MALHSWELQKSIYSTLVAANITDVDGAAISGVFDDVEEDTAYPYITIGEETAIDAGTKTKDAHEHTLTLHIWSRYRGGRKEVKEIMEQVFSALHNNDITVSGASLVNIRHEFEQTLVEADGITRHGIMRFRVVVFDN